MKKLLGLRDKAINATIISFNNCLVLICRNRKTLALFNIFEVKYKTLESYSIPTGFSVIRDRSIITYTSVNEWRVEFFYEALENTRVRGALFFVRVKWYPQFIDFAHFAGV